MNQFGQPKSLAWLMSTSNPSSLYVLPYGLNVRIIIFLLRYKGRSGSRYKKEDGREREKMDNQIWAKPPIP